jgi:hypothetical protein
MQSPCQSNRTAVKKTIKTLLSEAERRRYEDIVQIQTLLAEGYAPVQIKKMLNTTYFRIRRYATGDPLQLCRFDSIRDSGASQYRDIIVSCLTLNMQLKQILEQVSAMGYKGKRTTLGDYCRKLVEELDISYAPRRNAAGVAISSSCIKPTQHTVSKNEFLWHLWSGKEMDQSDIDFIVSKYPKVIEIQRCIYDFRIIFKEKNVELLEQFIARYSKNTLKPIKSFVSGLQVDLEAVKNSVTSDLSNGFVEGNNNKIKAIKRMMYGRAKIDLLRVKVLHAR